MSSFSSSDLKKGSVFKLMMKLAIPSVISQIVNMLYNIVDRMYIGNIAEIGINALAGLGLCFPIIMIVTAFSSLFGIGGAPRAAMEMGRGNNEKAEKIMGNCFIMLIMSSIVLTTVLLFFGEELLYLFGASDVTIVYAKSYLDIYCIGTIFVQASLGLNSFITTQGFTKFSMLTVLIGAIINIILDPIFIFALDMGVQGAALATIISQAISAVWVILFLTGKITNLNLKFKNMKLEKSVVLPVIALGLAPFIMQSTESILNVCFNSSLQKYGDDTSIAAMTILSSVMTLCLMPLQGLTQGAQPIISYNYGAGEIRRVKEAIKYIIIICGLFAFVLWLLAMTVPQLFVSIFNNDPEFMEYTVWAMRIYMAGTILFGIQISCQQCFVALGKAKVSLFLALLRKVFLLIPLIYILPNFFENQVFSVFLAEPIADILAAITTATTFFFVTRKTLKLSDDTKE